VGTLPTLIWLLRLAAPRTRRLIISGALAVSVIGAGLALVATRGDIVSRFFMGREFFFDWSWAEIQASPVIGAGAGNLMFAISERGVNERDVLPVHNVYLYVWGETGLIGMVLFVLGCGSVLGVISQRPERLIWGGALLGVCVTMLFDNYWWAILPYRVLFFWVIGSWWGLLSAEPAATITTSGENKG
jgi:O-antigen ligase